MGFHRAQGFAEQQSESLRKDLKQLQEVRERSSPDPGDIISLLVRRDNQELVQRERMLNDRQRELDGPVLFFVSADRFQPPTFALQLSQKLWPRVPVDLLPSHCCCQTKPRSRRS